MINNTSTDRWRRMKTKQLDNAFLSRIRAGMGCSPFESEAVLAVLHDIYGNFFSAGDILAPGQMWFCAVSVKVPASTALADAQLVRVKLTLDEPADLDVRQEGGVVGLRRHRLVRLCTEALQQGAVLSLEDLAFRIMNVGQRTLCSDLKALRDAGIEPPLRSTVKDMGRTLSHRRKIVETWLLGDEYERVAKKTRHSVGAVRNYISKFKRVCLLRGEIDDMETLAFLAGLSVSLAKEYVGLFENGEMVQHRREELLGSGPKKKCIPLFGEGGARD